MDSVTRTCRTCGLTKSLDEFSIRRDARRHTEEYRIHCKECLNKANKQFRKENPGYQSSAMRKSRYDITKEQFNALLEEQGGRCAICYKELDTPKIDHNHKTGAIRGIVCQACNVLLGKNGDNPELLRSKGYDEAAWYIERAKEREM